MNWLSGKKTILGSLAGGVLVIAWSLSLIDDDMAKTLLGLVAMWTGVSLRMAIKGAERANR